MTQYEFTPPKYKIGPKEKLHSLLPGWKRVVTMADGRKLQCSVLATRRVRIAFRGRQMGWKWDGQVLDLDTYERLFLDEVGGSIGCRGLLQAAGIFPRAMARCYDCWGHGRVMERPEGRSWGPSKKSTFICPRCSGTGLSPVEPTLGG